MDSVSGAASKPGQPWYRSTAVLVIASIVLPPLGLVLLWIRDSEFQRKVLGSLLIIGLSGFYIFLFFGQRYYMRGDAGTEAHYAELERQRAQQRDAPPGTPPGA